jgi:hypothetical protein
MQLAEAPGSQTSGLDRHEFDDVEAEQMLESSARDSARSGRPVK